MCTIVLCRLLVRTLGQVGRAKHRIWLGQLGQATKFRNSYTVGPQKVHRTLEYTGIELGDHYA